MPAAPRAIRAFGTPAPFPHGCLSCPGPGSPEWSVRFEHNIGLFPGNAAIEIATDPELFTPKLSWRYDTFSGFQAFLAL
jgi:hypothetical protein